MRLAEHGADAAHLEHQPLQHVVARARPRQELAGLAGQVRQGWRPIPNSEIGCAVGGRRGR